MNENPSSTESLAPGEKEALSAQILADILSLKTAPGVTTDRRVSYGNEITTYYLTIRNDQARGGEVQHFKLVETTPIKQGRFTAVATRYHFSHELNNPTGRGDVSKFTTSIEVIEEKKFPRMLRKPTLAVGKLTGGEIGTATIYADSNTPRFSYKDEGDIRKNADTIRELFSFAHEE